MEIETFFEKDFYRELEEGFPQEESFEQIQNKVKRMNYDTTYGDKLYFELIKNNRQYKKLHEYIYSREFIDYFLNFFRESIVSEIEKSYIIHNVFQFKIRPEPFETNNIINKKTHKKNSTEQVLYPRLDLGMGKEKYGINTGGKGIHIDNPQRLISILFYLGGYNSIEGGEHRIWKVKNSEELEVYKNIVPKPNLLIASLQNNIAFHDVVPIKKIDGTRNAFYIAISSSVKIWKDVKNININKKYNKNRYIQSSLINKLKSFFKLG